jgi:hypothetical protein
MRVTKSAAGGVYLAIAILTLIFQIYIRFHHCLGATDCGISVAKAVVWSAIWPVYWIVYLAGVVG